MLVAENVERPAMVACVYENRLASAGNAAISGVTGVRADYVDADGAAEVESVVESAAERQVNVANVYELARPEMAETGVGLSVAAETYAPHAVNDCGCSYSGCTEKTPVRFLSCFRLQCTSSCSRYDAND